MQCCGNTCDQHNELGAARVGAKVSYEWPLKAGRMSTKEYKGRTDSNSPTGPNETVHVVTLLLQYLFDSDKRIPKWKAPPHPPLSPAEAGRKRK